MSAPHILVVDDERDIRELVKEILEDEGYEVSAADSGEAARRARRERRPDLILLDIWMPDVDGITLLKEWSDESGPMCPVVIMSGHGTVETAVEATRLGAYDFIEKPLSMAKLLLTITHALEAERLRRENVGLRKYTQPLLEPLGKSVVMQQLRERIQRVAQHDASVLIGGEPGTGKELCARYLHICSPRRDGPFIDVGVAALLRENSAVELFGSEEDGQVRYGLLEQANGGTLFLDEVGDMDLAVQARLFSVLEGRSYLRVGGNEPVKLDVRIVAATHRDLGQEVQVKRFRDDLYYQLAVVPLHVPPLRDHADDIPELLAHYVDIFVNQEGLPYRRFTVAAQNRLRHYGWPGNIRELKNLVQRLLILGSGGEIQAEEVDAALAQVALPAEAIPVGQFTLPLREAREQFERAYFEYQLRQSDGSIGKVAKQAGMERTHLYRKLRGLGLNPKDVRLEDGE
jgi:two-component system nitrogen regulation response regulator NtrX